MYFEIIKEVETNEFADSRFANNGGGYSQPSFTLTSPWGDVHIADMSCGDFGSRYEVSCGEKVYAFDGVGREPWEISRFYEGDRAFVDAFNAEFPQYRIYTAEEIYKMKEE